MINNTVLMTNNGDVFASANILNLLSHRGKRELTALLVATGHVLLEPMEEMGIHNYLDAVLSSDGFGSFIKYKATELKKLLTE